MEESTQFFEGTMHSTPHLTSPSPLSTSPDPTSPLSNTSTPLQTFNLFPHLPTELRLKIFSHLLPPPTLHTISLPTCPSSCSTPSCPRQHVPRTTSSLPILLSINREARRECLRTYTILIWSGGKEEEGRGFTLAFDGERDSVYFCNGRGPERGEGKGFWSARGVWPEGIRAVPNGHLMNEYREGEMGRIRNLVIDEATLERGDYLKFPKGMMGLGSVTILLMPWSSPLSASVSGGGEKGLMRTFSGSGSESEAGGESAVSRGNDRDWGLKELRKEFMEWLEVMRIELGNEKKPIVKVAQWGACLKAGDGEGFANGRGQWSLIETGLWVHWEYNGRKATAD